MAQLLVLGVDSPQTAEKVIDLAAGGAASGALWGTLIGMLFRESERELIEALHRDYLAGPTGTTVS